MSGRAEGADLIRVPPAVFATIREAISGGQDPASAGEILRQAGLDAGETMYEIFRDWLSEAGEGAIDPERLEPSEFWSRLSDFFSQLGWGTLAYQRVHEGVIVITGRDWAEARHRSEGSAACPFTTGLLADILRRIAGLDLAALEVLPEYPERGECRILFGRPDVLDSVYERIRDGVRYEEAVASLP
jgi:predicted hydrocarbon binding protein